MHGAHQGDHPGHLFGRQQRRLTKHQGLEIHVGQGFYLNRQPQGLIQGRPKADLAVLGKQARQPAF